MKTPYILILALSIASLLSGCTTSRDEGSANEAHIERLMRQRSWPRIQQIATAEVKKREKAWPDNTTYVPVDHKDKLWLVAAMTATPNGDVQRTINLAIADDGAVLEYQRYWKRELLQPGEDWPGKK